MSNDTATPAPIAHNDKADLTKVDWTFDVAEPGDYADLEMLADQDRER